MMKPRLDAVEHRFCVCFCFHCFCHESFLIYELVVSRFTLKITHFHKAMLLFYAQVMDVISMCQDLVLKFTSTRILFYMYIHYV